MSEARNWLELPVDLVSVITKQLPDLPDFTRFRAVCKTWGSTPLSGCPPQLPWLLEDRQNDLFSSILQREHRFYSLSSGEIGTIHVDESHCYKEYAGPCQGYLLLNRQGSSRELSLLNPLTKAEISLPPVSVDVHWPVWISASRANEVMVVARDWDWDFVVPETCTWAYHHPDNKEWISGKGIFTSCCYWDGILFSTEFGKDTNVFHVTSKKLLHKIPPPACEIVSPDPKDSFADTYIIESTEEILRVCKFEDFVFHFHIHRLDFHGGKRNPSWVKIDNIGDNMIFLDEFNGFSISARPFAGFQGNCIYFVDPCCNKICRYDIKAGTLETIPCPFIRCSWFVPSLQQSVI